jgi:hypothetical protein
MDDAQPKPAEKPFPGEPHEIARLSLFLMNHYRDHLGTGDPRNGESAVDCAIRLLSAADQGCCLYAGPGRGDCEHFVGLPGKSIPGQHDGDDDTVDVYGRPNGWCWSCWKGYQLREYQQVESVIEDIRKMLHDPNPGGGEGMPEDARLLVYVTSLLAFRRPDYTEEDFIGERKFARRFRSWAMQAKDSEVKHRPEQNIYKKHITRVWDRVIFFLDIVLAET